MCTIAFLFQPGSPWPLILAGNRDEMQNRPSLSPGRHWADRPHTIAGLDQLAGGSWFGVNDQGVMSVIMNREGTLGPQPGKRSRGQLVLDALSFNSAETAADSLGRYQAADYRGFNLIIADAAHVFWLRHREERGGQAIEILEVDPGFHMLTSRELDDRRNGRIDFWRDKFLAVQQPDPCKGEWSAWQALMADRSYPQGGSPRSAMNISLPGGFSTVSSTLLALPSDPAISPCWFFADGAPDKVPYQAVQM